jgi:hypothetical protein
MIKRTFRNKRKRYHVKSQAETSLKLVNYRCTASRWASTETSFFLWCLIVQGRFGFEIPNLETFVIWSQLSCARLFLWQDFCNGKSFSAPLELIVSLLFCCHSLYSSVQRVFVFHVQVDDFHSFPNIGYRGKCTRNFLVV